MKLTLPLPRYFMSGLGEQSDHGTGFRYGDVARLERCYELAVARAEAAEAAVVKILDKQGYGRCRWCGRKWEEQDLQPHEPDCSFWAWDRTRAAHLKAVEEEP